LPTADHPAAEGLHPQQLGQAVLQMVDHRLEIYDPIEAQI
jgi:hypothetical protein